jgi:hypothetical protein
VFLVMATKAGKPGSQAEARPVSARSLVALSAINAL